MTGAIPLEVLLADDHPSAVLLVEGALVVAANAAAAVLLGPGAAAGAAVPSLFDERSRDKLAAAQDEGRRRTVELQHLHGDRAPVPVRFHLEPLGGRFLLVACGVGPDYRERDEQQLLEINARLANLTRELSQQRAQLGAAKADLERLVALREASMAALSHDIRSPLTAIVFQATAQEARAASLTPEDAARHAQAIRRNAARVLQLVDELLDASRLGSGEVEMAAQPTSLPAVAAEVVDSVEPIAAAAGVGLEVTGAQAGGWVSGDRLRLFQVLANLVNNAIRYSPSGSAVRIVIEEEGELVRCAVRDEGPGVPPDLREQVFDRFRQGGKNAGSVGLGLYIARRLVELHRGRLWLEEPRPRGAGFVFELPRMRN
jgi:signal transduction histidine kinase